MLRLFKPRHTHDWELVAVNDQYNTNYTDTGKQVFWHQRFYKCSCGSRKHTDDRPSSHNGTHKGIDEAQKNWIDAGVVPNGSYFPNEDKGYIKPSEAEREELDPVLKYQMTLEDIAKSLKVVLNRDFDLEARYPKLKEAADSYHYLLDKYRTFESLKDKENES